MKKSFLTIDFAAPLRSIVGVMFLIIITVTCTQVVCRYVFNSPLIWSEELVRFIVIWMCMLGAAVSSFDDTHMMINTFIEKFPIPLQFAVYTVRQAMILVFSGYCSMSSLKLVKAASHTTSGALEIPMGLWRAAGTVGLILVFIFTIVRYIKDVIRFKNNEFFICDGSAD